MDLQYLRHRRCSAIGCNSASSEYKLFRFPLKYERFLEWAVVSRNPRLDGVNIKSAYLCSRHFDNRQFKDVYRTLLIRGATPSISVPVSPEPSISSPQEPEPPDVSTTSISPEPDLSGQLTSTPLPKPLCSAKSTVLNPPDVNEPNISLNFMDCMLPKADDHIYMEENVAVGENNSVSSHKRIHAQEKIDNTIQKPTNREKKLVDFYIKNLHNLQNIKKKYKKAKLTIQKLTDAIRDPIKNAELLQCPMSSATSQSITSQIQCGELKPKRKSRANDDKLLALAMCKRSPKAYTFLQGIFTLPNKRKLNKMAKNAPCDV